MKRVTGLGGFFFKSQDPTTLRNWYREHLGIESQAWGAVFPWRDNDNPDIEGATAWNLFREQNDYFAPSEKPFMINYRVENLVALLELLKAEGVEQVGEMQDSEYGKFAWVMDPEGNKIELWEPPV
jgi:predicted enzyme related to lactoylglutathione lyase